MMAPMAIASLLIATAVPLIFLYVLYTLDLYGTGAFRTVAICFLWGGIAFALAYVSNTAMYDAGLVTLQELQRYAAPVNEELLKALILIYLVRRPNFTYFVDGAIYGFAVGIGFAIFENYSYILGGAGSDLGVAVGRVLSTNLMHATASALVGIALGFARFQRYSGRALILLGGLLAAMTLHVGFNNLVTRVSSGMLLVYAGIAGFAGVALITFAIKRGLAEEKAWIEETLGDADRVTAGEVAVVNRLADTHTILAPLADLFGQEKADQIERFLTLQARLGILRKTLEKLSDDKLRTGVEKQMDQIRTEMDDARRSVGTYCMLYLRNIFPEEASPLWGRLEAQIQERAAKPASSGVSLWASLGQRTTEAIAPASLPPVE